jgi:hypothetical protein
MADSNFRSHRTLDPNSVRARDTAANDPLADLARLIGRGDRHADSGSRDPYRPRRSADALSSNDDWTAEDDYAAQDRRTQRYDRAQHYDDGGRQYDDRVQRDDDRVQHYDDRARHNDDDPPLDRDRYQDEEPAAGRFFSGRAARFNGFGEETAEDGYASNELPPAIPLRAVPAYATADDEHESDAAEDETADDGYAPDAYDDEPAPRRRSGLVLVMAVCGLVVLGTAGAFAYRAMFGSSVLPTLPPIIKANDGPNKIVPDSQASNTTTGGPSTTGSSDQLVSREEQPVAIDSPKAAPHMVSTIPIVTGQGTPPGMPNAGQEGIWPAPPSTAALPPPPAQPMAAPPAASASTAPATAEPRRVHTVIVRSDQSGADAAAAQSAPAARAARSAATPPRPPASVGGSNAPMSIAPGAAQADAAAPTRTRVAAAPAAPVAVASAAPTAGVAAPASGAGGYAVQVTSQRSESEAQTAFRELQAKYPDQLGGREPIIRRADLGEKGVYFRALVGPFASSEQAAGLCSGLKAAGADCLIQRN